MDPAFSLALVTGLLGGFGHCIGMCGPIVASQALAKGAAVPGPGARLAAGLQYHAGRLLTYSLIGAVMGLSGSFADVAGGIAGLQNLAALLAGAVMVAMGIGIAGFGKGPAFVERRNGVALGAARKALAATSPFRVPLFGLAMGLLPCGLSYTAFIAAAGSGGALKGLLLALFFGLGTLPALLLFGTAVSMLGAAARRWITRAGGIVVVLMGLFYLYRGLRAPL
jgi:sulfite exporter TauE/SafE